MENLRTIVNVLFVPPGLHLVLLVVCAALWRLRPRFSRVLLWCWAGSVLVLCMPLVSSALTRATGSFAAFDGKEPLAQAIVVLAAERRDSPEYGGDAVGPVTLERLRLGAYWARATRLPVLLSGGRVRPSDAEPLATLMDRAWRGEFGLQARWLEDESRNTQENAQRSAAILHNAGIGRVILVTHYVHMKRAIADFTGAGIQVDPAPTGFPTRTFPDAMAAFWPRARCFEESVHAIHELYGLAGRALGADV